jgi:phage gp46-like protein
MGSPNRPYMDPVTRDWVIVNGSRRADETHTSEVLFHLDLQKGSAAAYPQWGSDFHKILKMTPNVTKQAEQAVEGALAVLTENQRIGELVPVATRQQNVNALKLDITWRDARGRQNERRLRIRVGGQ